MDYKDVRVSVVIPTHNRAAIVVGAVRSALAQTKQPSEIIVIDDCSTDGTPEAMAGITDRRLRYVRHGQNRGGSAARNTGIRAATGDYIAFLDDDDRWVPTKLERQLAAIGDWDAVLCRVRMQDTGRVDTRFGGAEIRPADLRRGFVFGGGTSSILVRTALARSTLFDESLSCKQDWDFMVRLTAACKVRFLKEPLVLFNNGGHERITHAAGRVRGEALERQLAVYFKHREMLGPFWLNYNVARRLRGVAGVPEMIRRCGLRAVSMVYAEQCKSSLVRRYAAARKRFGGPEFIL